MRVDAGLARLLGLSRTAVATIAEDGGVDIDGAPAAKSDKLVAGSWLEVRLPEAPAPLENTPQDIEGMAITSTPTMTSSPWISRPGWRHTRRWAGPARRSSAGWLRPVSGSAPRASTSDRASCTGWTPARPA